MSEHTTKMTVYLELDVDVKFDEDRGEDYHGIKYSQPCDYELSAEEGYAFPAWLENKILADNEELISVECQDAIDASHQDRLEEKADWEFEQQKVRSWGTP